MSNVNKNVIGKVEGNKLPNDLRICGRIILKWMSKKSGVKLILLIQDTGQ
jgi:hypothetical protein